MTTIQLTIPNWLDKICASPLLTYRRFKFGSPFRKIYLVQDKFTIVDPQDYYLLKNFNWWVKGNGTNLYAARNELTASLHNRTVYLHRQIMDPPPWLVVDHKNGDSLDNRRANLRLATHQQNMRNRRKRKNTTSQYIGVSFDRRRNKWIAYIRYMGKKIFLGRFDSEIEAAKAYDMAAKRYHIDFARLNFPDGVPVL